MKVFIASAVNYSLVEEDEGLVACAELVLLATEANWSVDAAGNMCNRSEAVQFRCAFSAKTLRRFSQMLGSYADDMEALEARASIAPPEEKAPAA